MMNPRTTFMLIAGLTAVLLFFLYAALQAILMRGFSAIERDSTLQNVEQAIGALSAELAFLDSKSADWANWDDSYAFMTDRNPAYVESNLTDQAFADLDVSVILYFQPDGQLFLGKAYDLENQAETRVPDSLLAHFSSGRTPLGASIQNARLTGLVLLPEGAMVVIARPILSSAGLGPSRGTLLMGRYIDKDLVGHVSRITRLAIEIHRWDEPSMPAALDQIRSSLSEGQSIVVRPIDEQTVAGSAAMYDIYGKPALFVNVTTPRPIYQQGRTTLNYVIAAIILVAVVCVAISQLISGRVHRAIQESEARYSLAAQGANDGLWDWDLDRKQIYYSPRWKSILGLQEHEVGSGPQEWLDRIHPDDRARVETEISAHLDGQTQFLESEHRMMHRGGAYIDVLCRGVAVRRKHGQAYRMAGSLSDISGRKRAEARLIHDALHDALTNLPNRVLFKERLERAIERSKRFGEKTFGVLYLDLDRFKDVNDSFGHEVGDQLLVASAHRLRLCARSVDTVARLGGDEFVILVEDIALLSELTGVAKRVLDEMELPFEIDGHTIFISTSIGVVTGAQGYDQAELVLRDADIAMYRAKSAGRDRFEVFDNAMRDHAVERLETEADLRGPVQRNEFEVYYQPVVRLQDRQVTGFEALLRWHHPTRGLIQPAGFMPVAEETGLIVPIGDWVLQRACAQMKSWLEQGVADPGLFVSVNLSAKQFGRPGLTQRIEEILNETGLAASHLHLEITEQTVMSNVEQTAATIGQLYRLGVNVEIDDYGTGYSSLSYLQQFPISTLKINRAFISGMGVRANGTRIDVDVVRTIVRLARQLGSTVVAEGIETADQLAGLWSLDGQLGQESLFSGPVAQDQAESLAVRTISAPA